MVSRYFTKLIEKNMTTIAVVKKNDRIVIAADTLTMWGSTKESAAHIENFSKIVRVNDSYLGFAGSSAYQLVIRHWLAETEIEPQLDSVDDIFDTFLNLHSQLKERYFIREFDDERDQFESSRMNILIANTSGIFGVTGLRSVTEYKRFSALGSGCDYAIGAMHAIYRDEARSAIDIAKVAIEVSAEFDDSTGLPVESYEIELK